MKRILSFLVVITLLFIGNVYAAAQRTATFGDLNASNVYRLRADMDSTTSNCSSGATCGWITYAQDTGIYEPYTAYASATTNFTLVPAQSGTTVVFNNSTSVAANLTMFTLPAATVGMNFTFVTDIANQMIVHPAGTDQIMYSTIPAGNGIKNTSAAIGDSIELFCVNAGNWSVKHINGTWANSKQ